MDSNYDIMLQKISLQNRIPYHVVKNIVESQFEAVGEINKSIDITQVQSKEELDKMKTNFSFKYLMSLVMKFKKIQKVREHGI